MFKVGDKVYYVGKLSSLFNNEMFIEYFNKTIVKSSILVESEYCDDELIFRTSPELLYYFITYKRIEKIEKIKERINDR